MSSLRRQVIVAPRAAHDFEDILLHSLHTWGDEQARRYQAALDRAIDGLEDFPEIGPTRDDLPAGFRMRFVEQHIIYYRIEEETIRVVRILHRRQQVSSDLLE